jgi:hypothetical protein
VDASSLKLYDPSGLEYLAGNFFLWGNSVFGATPGYWGVKRSSDGVTWNHAAGNNSVGAYLGMATDNTTVVLLTSLWLASATTPFSSFSFSGVHGIDTTYTVVDIAFGAGLFCVVGYKAGVGVGIWTRVDATSGAWTKQNNPTGLSTSAQIRDLRYDSNLGFLAVCQNSAASYFCLKSTDGVTWTKHAMQNTSGFMEKLAVNAGRLVAAGSSGTKMEVSIDGGATWIDVPFFTDLLASSSRQMVWQSLSATPTGFLISTRTGTGSTPNWYEEQVYQSDNGVSWTQAAALPEGLGAAENENAGPFAHNGTVLVHAIGNGLSTAAANHAVLTTI